MKILQAWGFISDMGDSLTLSLSVAVIATERWTSKYCTKYYRTSRCQYCTEVFMLHVSSL